MPLNEQQLRNSEHFLEEAKTEVSVRVIPDPIGILWGALDNATISAKNFDIQELPLFVEPTRSKAGRCGNLKLNLTNFKLRGLRVESLEASIPACRYDRTLALTKRSFRLSRSGVGIGTVKILESDLGSFILKKFHEIKSVSVRVLNGIVWVEGVGEFLIVKSGFTVIAELQPIGGSKLQLSNAKVWFDWRRADDFSAQTLLKTLNPVVDFDKDLGLYGAINVKKVTLEDGVLTATGETKIPTKP